jgi:hypothetical protein
VVVVRASGPISAIGAAWEALRQQELGDSSSGRVFRAQAGKVRVETRRPRFGRRQRPPLTRAASSVAAVPSAA